MRDSKLASIYEVSIFHNSIPYSFYIILYSFIRWPLFNRTSFLSLSLVSFYTITLVNSANCLLPRDSILTYWLLSASHWYLYTGKVLLQYTRNLNHRTLFYPNACYYPLQHTHTIHIAHILNIV